MNRRNGLAAPFAGVLMVVTGLAVTVVGSTAPEGIYTGTLHQRYLAIAADEASFLRHNILFAVTMPVALGAMHLLGAHVRRFEHSDGAGGGLVLLAVATGAFVVEVLLRVTLILDQAREVAGGAAVPDHFFEHPGIGELSPPLLVFRVTGAAGFAMLAWATSRTPMVGRAVGRALAVIGAAAFLTIPLAPYLLAVAPLGAAVIARYLRVAKAAPSGATA